MKRLRAHRGLAAILLVYLVAGAVWSFLAPLGEAPDETDQFEYIRYCVERRRVPGTVQDRLDAGGKSDEPPLYYALVALATGWVDVRPLPRLKLLDPELYPRHSLPDEVLINYALLHTADEQWPFRGLVLQWHLARLLTLGLGAATVVVLYASVRRVSPRRPDLALVAAAAAALNPQFIYISASLNNDNLAALWGAILVWLLLRLAEGDLRWRGFVLLGLLLGLTRMTKFYTLAMLPVVAIVLAALAWRRRRGRYLAGLGLALGLSVAVSLPWLLHIQPLDPAILKGAGRVLVLFDIVRMERWFSPRGEGTVGSGPLAIARAAVDALRLGLRPWAITLFKSFWAFFGPMTVQAPRAVYAVVAALSGLAVAGWARIAADRLRRRPTVLDGCRHLGIPGLQLAAFLGMEVVFFGVMKVLPYTAQGRHLFPALAGIAALLALGWWALWPRLAPGRWALGVGAVLVGLGVACLPTVVRSASKPYLPVRAAPWPGAPTGERAIPLGDGLELLGGRWQAERAGELRGTLYWHATQPPTDEIVIILELVDRAGQVCAVWAGHPGGSRYPTQAWDAGDYVRQALDWPLPPLPADRYTLCLRAERALGRGPAVELAALELPAPAPPAQGGPAVRVYGLDQAVARLRDTVLITWPGAGLEGLVAADGGVWQPLALSARGDQAAFVVAPRVPPGAYTLRGEGSQAAIRVVGRQRNFQPPPGLEPLGAVFAGGVELAGYSLGEGGGAARVTPGETLPLRLAWRARGHVERHYTVFAHLIDPQGRVWGQHDKLPAAEYSTLFWAPGEIVVDEYSIPVNPAAPPGSYRLAVGLYRALGGQRAPARDGAGQPLGDQVLLGDVAVMIR